MSSSSSSSSHRNDWECLQYEQDANVVAAACNDPLVAKEGKSADLTAGNRLGGSIDYDSPNVIVELPPGGLGLVNFARNKQEDGDNTPAMGQNVNGESLNSSFVRDFSGVFTLKSLTTTVSEQGHPQASSSGRDAASSSVMSSFVAVPSSDDIAKEQVKPNFATGLLSCSSSISSSWSHVKNQPQQPTSLAEKDNSLLQDATTTVRYDCQLSTKRDCELWTELQEFLEPYYASSCSPQSIVGPCEEHRPFCPLPKAALHHRLVQFCTVLACMNKSKEFYKISLKYKIVLLPKPQSDDDTMTTVKARVWKDIGARGFARDSLVRRAKEPVWVANTLEGAWNVAEHLQVSGDLQSSRSFEEWINGIHRHHPSSHATTLQVMPSIREDYVVPQHNSDHDDIDDEKGVPEDIEDDTVRYDDDDDTVAWAWVVAVAESTSDTTSREAPYPPQGSRRRRQDPLVQSHRGGSILDVELSQQVLPLVCFNPNTHGTSDEIRILMNSFTRIFWNFRTSLVAAPSSSSPLQPPSEFQAMRQNHRLERNTQIFFQQ